MGRGGMGEDGEDGVKMAPSFFILLIFVTKSILPKLLSAHINQ